MARIALSMLATLLIGLTPSTGALAERQSLASITLQAEEFIAAYPYEAPYPARFKLASLDSRLRLKPCGSPLKIDFSHPDRVMGNTSLAIRCPAPVAWDITLPVHISVFQDVIVNNTPLIKGQGIDADRVSFRKMDVSRLNQGYFSDLSQLGEFQARRNLKAGTVLDPGNLVARQLIKPGQQVTILYESGGISIKSSGKALHAARLGEVARVKNSRSNRIIEGTVTAPGRIRVSF